MKNQITLSLAVLVGACCVAGAITAQDDTRKAEKKETDNAAVMADKLRYTQQLLTSLAKEDFPVLENSAQELRRIAHEQWQANSSPEYRTHLQTFWTALDGIEFGAQRKEIEEATLAYMQMTLTCIRCHKAMRRSDTP